MEYNGRSIEGEGKKKLKKKKMLSLSQHNILIKFVTEFFNYFKK